MYQKFGSVYGDSDSKSLARILSDHSVDQVYYADAYRYGLLTETMHGQQIEQFENEHREYLTLPSAVSRGRLS